MEELSKASHLTYEVGFQECKSLVKHILPSINADQSVDVTGSLLRSYLFLISGCHPELVMNLVMFFFVTESCPLD